MALQSFLSQHARDGGLFQSDEWARLQAASGHEAYPLQGVGFDGHAFVHVLPLIGRYLFLPRGPVIDTTIFASEEFRRQLIGLTETTESSWIRVEPQTEEILEILRATFGADQVVAAPRDMNPRETLMASLDGELNDWLLGMKPKTRYNVRLAEKHGVTVRFSRESEDMDIFLNLITTTASRKAIAPHPKAYYRNFLTALPEEMCTLAIAEYQGVPVAAALLGFFSSTAYYLHGGSGDVHRELMAPFLLHFKCMEEAKRRGCARYDFGGVRIGSKNGVADTGWDGITRFKQGFAPKDEPLLFPGTYDIIVSPARYALYRQSRHLARAQRAIRNILSRFSS